MKRFIVGIMTDIYIQDRARLQGQPKRTIGDYVASHGILVPRRFDTVAEARATRVPILARSEHEQDYEGASGLIPSIVLSRYPQVTNTSDLKEVILNEEEQFYREKIKTEIPLEIYCALLGLDYTEVKTQVSFSLWEEISGMRRTVIADSAISGKYHIFSKNVAKTDRLQNYSQWYNGLVTSEHYPPLNSPLGLGHEQDLTGIVELYTKIRHLSNFDSNHAPIMEMISTPQGHYFVQYHRGRDFQEASFKLHRDLKEGEIQAVSVRGSTVEQGVIVQATVAYAQEQLLKKTEWTLPNVEDSSFDLHMNTVFSEIMSRQRKVQMVHSCESKPVFWMVSGSALGHLYISDFFKPEISLFFDHSKLLREREVDELRREAKRTDSDQKINVFVISDGNTAYLKRV